MKLKLIVSGIGANNAQMEIEETCELSELKTVVEKVESALGNLDVHTRTPQRTKHAGNQERGGTFIPASEPALKAFFGACVSNRTDVETVCREYGVDPNHISKRDCWRMTQDLNENTGYGKPQQRPEQPPNHPGRTYKIIGGDNSSFWNEQ